MSRYKITMKEVGRIDTITSEFNGDVNEAYLIKHYGLNEPDIEWYDIEKIS